MKEIIKLLLYKALLEVYGPHRLEKTEYGIIIHYPQLTISNSKGSSHKIYDLFVKIPIHIDGTIMTPRGLRMTFTKRDLLFSYIHSHLSALEYSGCNTFKLFCVGDSDFTVLTMQLNSAIRERETPNPMYMDSYVHLLDNFLKYESLEGGPYKFINNLYASSYSDQSVSEYIRRDTIKIMKDILSLSEEEIIDILPDFYINDLDVQFFHSKKLDNFIQEKAEYKCFRDEFGNETYPDVFDNSINVDPKSNQDKQFIFNGKLFKFKIKNAVLRNTATQNDVPKDTKSKIYERIKLNITQRLSKVNYKSKPSIKLDGGFIRCI